MSFEEPIDFTKLIHTGDTFAEISFLYKGSASAGMLAWLDGEEMKAWWRAENVIVQPYPGGMFYVAWSKKTDASQHAVFGVIDKVDTESNSIKVTKIFYMSPTGKLGPIQLEIQFEDAGNGYTKIWLRHTHDHGTHLLKLYKQAVYESWPKTFALLKSYLESNTLAERS